MVTAASTRPLSPAMHTARRHGRARLRPVLHDVIGTMTNTISRCSNTIRSKKFKTMNGILLDETHPHLWLTQDNLDLHFGDVLQSVLDCDSMHELSVYNILTAFTPEDVQFLYNAIARQPNLQNFKLWASSCVTVPTLISILTQAPGLKSACFCNIEISSVEDLTLLSETIRTHPSLNKLNLENLIFQLPILGTPQLSLDLLLQAVARNPHITSLCISTEPGTGMVFEAVSLTMLCQSLTELIFSGFKLSDRKIFTLSQALTMSPRRLTTLGLYKNGSQLTLQGYNAMVEMLQHNFQLQKMHVDPPSAMGTDFTAKNRSSDFSETLQELQWRMEFLLHWNKTGIRTNLFRNPNATRESWLNALSAYNQDLNSLYYLLQASGTKLLPSSSKRERIRKIPVSYVG